MKLFTNPVSDWENQMTEEEIKQLEAQGCNVAELRAKRTEQQKMEEEAKQEWEEERAAFQNPTALDKLAPYTCIPRSMDTPFFKATAGSAPWLFKDRWQKKYTEAPLIYAAVVQANTALWLPGNNENYPAVFVFALDEKHIRNSEWLKETAETIYGLQDADRLPDDCCKLIETLRDESSAFCFRIGRSICGDADAWCATYEFDKQIDLPRKALPSDRIVPFLLKSAPVENQFVDLKLIPSEFYIG